MCIQRVIFLYCSESGEAFLQNMISETIQTLDASETSMVQGFFEVYKVNNDDKRSIRVWFEQPYHGKWPQIDLLKRFVEKAPEAEFFFARFGEGRDEVESKGMYDKDKFDGLD